jgi:uncharacterized glyoxalase superfamily protein PhnB
MRFMVMIKANADTEAGAMPSQQLLAEMGRFNEELVKAGVMLAGEGLHPSSKGARVTFSGNKRTVVDGPFAESKELIAGYWVWQVRSKEEALEWVKRCPNPMDGESQIEIRQLFEAEDFGEEFTPELREQEERLRAQIASQATDSKSKVEPVPAARGATPYLVVKGAADAIAYYQRTFGAELLFRMDTPDGKVMHAELAVGPARFMLTEEQPQYGALSPKTLGGSASTAIVHVPNVDATFDRAVSSGSTVTMPLADQFWGDRSGAITDPFGHKWMIATHIEDPSPDEIKRRVQKMFESGAPC